MPQPTGSPLAVWPGQRVGDGGDGERPAAGDDLHGAGRDRRARRGSGVGSAAVVVRDVSCCVRTSAACACASSCAICCAFSCRCCRRPAMYASRSARVCASARVVASCARTAAASLAVRASSARDGPADARLRVVQLREHVVVDRRDALQAVELDQRLVERPRAEEDLERARVAVVEEQPDARGEVLLRDARAAQGHLQLGLRATTCSRRSVGGLALEIARASRCARDELRVERVEARARPSAPATRATRSRPSGGRRRRRTATDPLR